MASALAGGRPGAGTQGRRGTARAAPPVGYDPRANAWTPMGRLRMGRALGVVALLRDGQVLVAGGCCDHTPAHRALTEAEVYDPTTGVWSPTAAMRAPCRGPATTLRDGRVLVTGCGAGSALSGAEVFT